MRPETVAQIVQAAGALGLRTIEAFPDYSGRGMYGQTTHAVVAHTIGEFAAAVGQAVFESDDPEALIEDVRRARSDSLGLDLVVY